MRRGKVNVTYLGRDAPDSSRKFSGADCVQQPSQTNNVPVIFAQRQWLLGHVNPVVQPLLKAWHRRNESDKYEDLVDDRNYNSTQQYTTYRDP